MDQTRQPVPYPTLDSEPPAATLTDRAPLPAAEMLQPLGVRWTIGNVHPCGFAALRLSVWGAWKLFGRAAEYVICVNSKPLAEAEELAGSLPPTVQWRDVSGELPGWLQPYLAENLSEGTAWKFAPLQLFPDRFELALDNDCILWDWPRALRDCLCQPASPSTVIAADTQRMLGKFAGLCGPEPRNSGIRGIPPEFDLEERIRGILTNHSGRLDSELDEQGLQVAAVTGDSRCRVVELDEVAICSPFPNHRQQLGSCGAHFVGLNAWSLPWEWQGRPATTWTREFWLHHQDEIASLVEAPQSIPTS